MSNLKDNEDLVERATEALRDEPVRLPPPDLFERTQTRVNAVRNGVAATPRSPYRHPLFRVAAAVTLLFSGAAVYVALRAAPPSETIAGQGDPVGQGVASGMRQPGAVESAAVVVQTNGSVRGLVRFAGTAPEPKSLSMAANAHCAAHHKGRVIDESVLVNGDGTLRNVVIWVSGGLEGRRFEPPREPAVLDQQGCVYTPHVVTVMTGQRLLVKNSDPFLHNVHAAAANNPPFNFGQPTVDGGKPLVFLSPERMFVKCDVHPWMSAYIHVLDNPFFAVSGTDGAFDLPDLPSGRYTISAWHEVFGEERQQVTVAPGKPLELEFTFFSTRRADARPAPGVLTMLTR